jgi:hypothetical protein
MNAPASELARIEPTDAQLRAAWALLRRHTWPQTFEAAMDDPVLGRLVRMEALHKPAPHTPAPQRPQPAPQAPPRPMPQFVPPPGYVDIKRRASGERDDD